MIETAGRGDVGVGMKLCMCGTGASSEVIQTCQAWVLINKENVHCRHSMHYEKAFLF
jgi:hypothetical protein